MPRWAMVIDLNACVGCEACVLACLYTNTIRDDNGRLEMPEPPYQYARTRPVRRGSKVPNLPKDTPFFIQCHHCENAPCVKVCPTGASFKTEDGIVLINKDRCIGCRACMIACPYGVRTMYLGRLKGELGEDNPYALLPGYPDKCTFCAHKKPADGGPWTPSCVEACAFNARIFGDLDDPNSEVSKLVRAGATAALLEHLGTKPKLFIIPPRKLR